MVSIIVAIINYFKPCWVVLAEVPFIPNRKAVEFDRQRVFLVI
jgi:hypothetical protein